MRNVPTLPLILLAAAGVDPAGRETSHTRRRPAGGRSVTVQTGLLLSTYLYSEDARKVIVFCFPVFYSFYLRHYTLQENIIAHWGLYYLASQSSEGQLTHRQTRTLLAIREECAFVVLCSTNTYSLRVVYVLSGSTAQLSPLTRSDFTYCLELSPS